MKKLLYYNTIFFLLITLLVACKKQGPDGPAGPEGPPGNPGPSGSSGGGGGNGKVMAFTSDAANVFKWEKSNYAASSYTLTRASDASSENYDYGYYVMDEEGVIPDGVVLVYLHMKKKNSTQEAVWYGMPFLSGTMGSGAEEYTAQLHYQEQGGGNDFLAVYIRADIEQKVADTPPSYDVSGIKIIVIASDEVYSGGRNANLKTLSLEAVMERYHMQETDFKILR